MNFSSTDVGNLKPESQIIFWEQDLKSKAGTLLEELRQAAKLILAI